VMEVECDLFPRIKYRDSDTGEGYKGLNITVERSTVNETHFDKVRLLCFLSIVKVLYYVLHSDVSFLNILG